MYSQHLAQKTPRKAHRRGEHGREKTGRAAGQPALRVRKPRFTPFAGDRAE